MCNLVCLKQTNLYFINNKTEKGLLQKKKREKHMGPAATKWFLFFKLTALGKLIFFFASNVYLQLSNKLPKKVGMTLLSLLRSLFRS